MHRKTSQLRLRFIGASLGALLLAGAGAAQAQTAPASDATGTTSPVAQPTTEASAATDELVVTAEKRAVNIQDVPASVSAISGDKLEVLGLKSLQDYTRYVPGLVVNSGGSPGQTSVVLRGIAAIGPGSVVGYYIDDTPVGSSNNYARATTFALDLLPYDLERLEVLRGPQGTLYGAGAMGGLLKYVLRQADPNKFDARVGAETSYISHSDAPGYAVRGAVNIPLIKDKLALRLSAFDQKDQGYVDNDLLGLHDVNDVHQYGGRAAVTFKPMDNLRINLNALWYRLKSDDNNSVNLTDISSETDPKGAPIFTGLPVGNPYGQNYAFRQPFRKDIDYYSGTVNWDLGTLTAVSATSWQRTKTRQTQDATGVYGPYPTYVYGLPGGVSDFRLGLNLDKFTQEFRLVSPTGGRIEWLLGAFYTHEKSTNMQTVDVLGADYKPVPDPAGIFTPFFVSIQLPTTYREYAAFGDLTFKITDRWDVTGGLRYAHNDQDFQQISTGVILGGTVNQPGSSSESVATWQVNTRYHLSDHVMAYARVATGYRPGGPNVVLAGAPPSVGSDRLTSYEAGFKTTSLDGRLLFNATAYDIEWRKIQLAVYDAALGASYAANAGDAYSRGAELEGFFIPTEGLRLGFNAAYTKGRVTKLLDKAPPFVPGEPLPGVPEFQGGTTLDYTWNMAGDWRPALGVGWTYRGNSLVVEPVKVGGIGYTEPTRNPAYSQFDAHAGVSNDRWAVNLYVRNITDHRAYLQSGSGVGAGGGFDSFLLQPRTVGISVDASF